MSLLHTDVVHNMFNSKIDTDGQSCEPVGVSNAGNNLWAKSTAK
jgi:hypothetical protein